MQSLTSIVYRDGRVASKNLIALMGDNYFTNPKDVDILMKLINAIGLCKQLFSVSGNGNHCRNREQTGRD